MTTPYRSASPRPTSAKANVGTWFDHIQRSAYCFRHYSGVWDSRTGKLACPCGWMEAYIPTLQDILHLRQAAAAQGDWVPANNRQERPFDTRTGRRLLYCWQPSTGRHAYLDVRTDTILTDEEARLALGY